MAYVPTQFTKSGTVVVAKSWTDHLSLLRDGWSIGTQIENAPPRTEIVAKLADLDTLERELLGSLGPLTPDSVAGLRDSIDGKVDQSQVGDTVAALEDGKLPEAYFPERLAQEMLDELVGSRISIEVINDPGGVAGLDGNARVAQANLPAHLTTDKIAEAILGVAGRKPEVTDGTIYLSKNTKADDANDGLTPGTAKATLDAAVAACPDGGRVLAGTGSWSLGSGPIGFNHLPGKRIHFEGIDSRLTKFVYDGTGIAWKIGDGRTVTDLAVTAGSLSVATSASGAFTDDDIGRTLYTPEGIFPADTFIVSRNSSTSVNTSKPASGATSGATAHISKPFNQWGSMRNMQIEATAFSSQTAIKMYDAHDGDMEHVRALGNSYSAGSRGIHAINCFTNYYRRLTIQNFESGVDLDGACHDGEIGNSNIGAKKVCVRVKNSTDVRVRGGQHSTTGPTQGGIGLMAICTYSPSTDGGCDGLLVDQVHYEGNGTGLDVAIGRAADGSTAKIRNPKIDGKLVSGGTLDKVTNPIVERLTIAFDGAWVVTNQCADLMYIGKRSINGTFTDNGVRSTSLEDLRILRNGSRIGLDVLGFPFGVGQGSTDVTQDSSAYMGGYIHNITGTPAVNDRASWSEYLTAGTYAMDIFYKRGPDCGDFTVSLAGVPSASQNGYAASPDARRLTLQPFTVATSGMTGIEFKIVGKNGASTNFIYRLSHITLRRTG